MQGGAKLGVDPLVDGAKIGAGMLTLVEGEVTTGAAMEDEIGAGTFEGGEVEEEGKVGAAAPGRTGAGKTGRERAGC